MVETLYQDKNHKIDFYRSVSPARGLVYTFTSIAFSDLNASGFGVHFLLGLGYDVVAFKCNNASWYQGLDFDTVRAVGRKSSGYEQVATYGTSMGGYAAILFSKALGANLVLALSPQFSLAESFEQRWRDKTKGVEWRHEISAETIAAQATYMILYDDKFMLDVRQMAGLKAILPPACDAYGRHPLQQSSYDRLSFGNRTADSDRDLHLAGGRHDRGQVSVVEDIEISGIPSLAWLARSIAGKIAPSAVVFEKMRRDPPERCQVQSPAVRIAKRT